MILILSENNDKSTSITIEWLLSFNKKFKRINHKEDLKQVKLNINNQGSKVEINDKTSINFNEITAYWYRRGALRFQVREMVELPSYMSERKAFKKTQKDELTKLEDYLHLLLDKKKSINSYFTRGVNKLQVLNMAQEVGIAIPPTLITSEKKELIAFRELHGDIITKAIHEIPLFKNLELTKSCFTTIVQNEIIEELPDNFFPSLFQSCIDKKYELRIFYLNGNCKSMVIFSQEDNQTSVDFRNYNDEYPNRTVPFNLPESIRSKIDRLMQNLNINCGSIDMILTKNNEFIFLEVNPIGQFGMTSWPCNYYLEKDIADFLSTP